MPINNEVSTAKICAFSRAYHSNVSRDKVFDDYLAYDLMGKEEYDSLYELIAAGGALEPAPGQTFNAADFINSFLTPVTLPRISFTESKLRAFSAQHGPCQYVICGAGYDTFSFRNNNPHIEIFEVDHPDMQAFKKKRIADLQWNIPHNVHFVAVDFEKGDFIQQLFTSGFDPNRKAFFSILGVAYYLTLPVFVKTIVHISAISTPGSMLVFDYPDENIHRSESAGRAYTLAKMTEKLGEKMNGGYNLGELNIAMCKEGFQIENHLDKEDIQKQFFNGKGDGFRALKNIYLISAIKE